MSQIILYEEWKSIKGYEGVYSISNFGNVRREGKFTGGRKSKGPYLKYKFTNKGYAMVGLCKKSKHTYPRVHCLVAEHFIGIRPIGLQINHIDGVKINNNYKNLEYVTNSQNQLHRRRVLGHKK